MKRLSGVFLCTLVVLFFCLLLSVQAVAYEPDPDDSGSIEFPVTAHYEYDIQPKENFAVFHYEVINEEVTITGYDGTISGELVIPYAIEDYLVTGIQSNAFAGSGGMTAIILPDTIDIIGEGAFADCDNLQLVWYLDSKSAKQRIVAHSGNDALINAIWHYEVEEVSFAGQTCFHCAECSTCLSRSGEEVLATVVFQDWDGRVLSSNTYGYGQEVTPPAAPARAESETHTYTFTGWDPAVTVCTDHATYTAQYKAVPKKDGWVWENGNNYYYEDGEMLTSRWINYKGVYYYVGADGARVSDVWIDRGHSKSYLTEWGYMATNRWVCYKGTWYYVDADGYRLKDIWMDGANGKCYLTPEGYMAVNRWVCYKNVWYYVGSNGARLTDIWMDGANGKCYLTPEGYMAVNRWVCYKNVWYYVGSNGARLTDIWMDGANGKCYLTPEGYMATNRWICYKNVWYYVGANGARVTDKWVMGGNGMCYLTPEGYMATNRWVIYNGQWVYVGENGAITTK